MKRICGSSGAGDCFVAGTVHALCQGELIDEAIMYGLGAAKCAVECEESVPVDLTQEKVHKAYMQVRDHRVAVCEFCFNSPIFAFYRPKQKTLIN